MPEQLTQEELNRMSPAEKQEHQQRQIRERKWCHRGFRNHLLSYPVQAQALEVPGEAKGVGLQVQVVPTSQLCEQEDCMMWDARKRRCLDRSAAIAQAYGKDAPQE